MQVWDVLESCGMLFYLVDPRKHVYATTEKLPSYLVEVIPHFFVLFLIEQSILLYMKKPTFRINEAFASISQGILEQLTRLLIMGYTLVIYVYIYNNWRIVTLQWDSTWTWVISFLAVDFAYYWGHRTSHSINFIWAAHQVHHLSEDYNVANGLRISFLQGYFHWVMFLPLALFVPPSAHIVHFDLNVIYQFWIHTEVVRSIGPLEYILNTPSHHRVHHGRNRYCIDKNFAGVLIIWDRIFGTFEPEGEEVVYGLTHPINTFEGLTIQLHHYINILKTFWKTKGLRNKLFVIIKGPGWYPGMPWHGSIEDVPDVKAPVTKYDPVIPFWCKIYTLVHLAILSLGFISVYKSYESSPSTFLYTYILFHIYSSSSLGMLLDGRMYATLMEIVRCVIFFVLDFFFFPITEIVALPPVLESITVIAVRVMFGMSLLVWISNLFGSIRVKLHTVKKEKGL